MGYCWCCRDVAILVVWVVFVFFAILGLSFVPILDNAIHVAGQQLPSGPAYIVFSFLATFHSILGNIGSSPTIIAVGQYYYDPKIASTAGAYTEGGVGMVRRYDVLSKLAGMKVGETLIRYFHEAVKGASHDPYLAKDEGQILGTDLSTWELGELFIPTSLRPVLLSLNTGGRRHSARRHLLADALHALGQHPPTIPDFVAPPGVEPGELFYGKVGKFGGRGIDRVVPEKEVDECVGFLIYRHLFGLDLSMEQISLVSELTSKLNRGIGHLASPEDAERFAQVMNQLMIFVEETEVGQGFLSLAKERDMDGESRLQELLLITHFAGHGGTTNQVQFILDFIVGNPEKYLPLYRKDPEAFVLEVARLFPFVSGFMFEANKNAKRVLDNGFVHVERAGDTATASFAAANVDPTIFGGPDNSLEYAMTFIPGRENADRTMTWVNELRDFRTCDTVAGCAAAPRACPGAHLSVRIMVQATTFFVDAIADQLMQAVWDADPPPDEL